MYPHVAEGVGVVLSRVSGGSSCHPCRPLFLAECPMLGSAGTHRGCRYRRSPSELFVDSFDLTGRSIHPCELSNRVMPRFDREGEERAQVVELWIKGEERRLGFQGQGTEGQRRNGVLSSSRALVFVSQYAYGFEWGFPHARRFASGVSLGCGVGV